MEFTEITYDSIYRHLQTLDHEYNFEEFCDHQDKDFDEKLTLVLNEKNMQNYSVLGIDIYRYSKYPIQRQIFIPFLFDYLFNAAIFNCLRSEPFLFQNYNKASFEKNFISTGDGGFLILETPLHSLVFALYFEAILRCYNSFFLFPKFRNFVGELTLRYSITNDKLFNYRKNFYGPAIINCARILSKDKLNRCLLDQNTYEWFQNRTLGIESLRIKSLEDFSSIPELAKYDLSNLNGDNILFKKNNKDKSRFYQINISKLRQIEAKESHYDIFNLQIQVDLTINNPSQNNKQKHFVVTIGNLNIEGINL
jgi:hypothetical protein